MKPLAIAVLALGVTMLTAFAQQAPEVRPRPEAPRQKLQDRLDHALNLTDAQKASVKEIHARHQGALEAKRKAAGDTRRAFGEALRKGDTPAADLKKLHAAMADANLDLLLEHRAQRQEVHAVLTPEQREKAARMDSRWFS